MIIILLLGLLVGIFFLVIFWFKMVSVQWRTMRLIQKKEHGLYEKLFETKLFKGLGLPNTFLGFAIWPSDDWRQLKFFLSSVCLSTDEEVCHMRGRARKLMFAFFIAFVLWVLLFFGIFFFELSSPGSTAMDV